MSCSKCGSVNTSCGCNDTAYATVKTFTCPPDTLCPTPIKCSQFLDAACVYLTDGIVDAGIQPGSSLESIVQQLVLLVTNPGCVDAPGGVPGGGTVTSVALDMPNAFTVLGSPIQNSGTFVVTVNGNSGQYIDGIGNLQDFPVAPSQVLFQTNSVDNTDQTLLNLVAGSARVTLSESSGTVTIDVPVGQQYISTNGIEERPAATFRLGGALVEDTTIDGAGNSFTLSGTLFQTFDSDRLDIVTTASGAKMGSTGGTADSSVEVTGTAATLQSVTGGTATKFIAEPSKLKLQTAAYSSANNNDVLTLIDKTTGEVEYLPAASGIVLRTNNTNNVSQAILNLTAGSNMTITDSGGGVITFAATGIGVTNVSVASANGLAGTVASPGTTPIITLSTTVGSPGTPALLKGNGTAITAAVANIDYSLINGTGIVKAVGTALTYVNGTSLEYIKGDGTLGTLSAIVPADGTLSVGTTTTGATNTSVTLAFNTTFSANTANNALIRAVVGVALVNYATQLTSVTTGLLRKTAADTITIDTATYLTSTTGVVSVSGGSTGLTPATATSGAVVLGGTLGVGYGGTGLVSVPTNGQLLIGNGTNYTLATLTGASGVSITNSAGGITIGLSGGPAGVTTFETSIPGLSPSTGTAGAVVLSGTVGVGGGGTGQTTAAAAFNALSPITAAGQMIIGTGVNTAGVLAAPTAASQYLVSTSTTAASWQTISPSGVTTWSGGTTGLLPAPGTSGAVTLTGTLAIANGGTGQTTAITAFNALAPTTTNGDIIYYNGTNNIRLGIGSVNQVLTVSGGIPSWQTITGAVSSFQTSLSGLSPSIATAGAVTLSGTLGVASGGTGATTLTGVVIGSATTAMTAVAGTGSQLLRRNVANTAYEFFTPTFVTSAIQSLNGLTGATQTFTNDTNVTITSGGTAHVLGWTGVLSTARGGTGLSTIGTASQVLRVNSGGTALEYASPSNATITLGADLSGSGTTTINATIVANAITTGKILNANVTYAKIQNVAANTFLGNATGSVATVQEISTTRIPLFTSAIGGTPSAATYLDGSGNWSAPATGGAMSVYTATLSTERTNNLAPSLPGPWSASADSNLIKITTANGGLGWLSGTGGSYNILTGLASKPAGSTVTILNTGTNNLLIIEHSSTISSATNRFKMAGNMAYFLMPNKSVTFYHDGSTWVEAVKGNTGGFDYFDDCYANPSSRIGIGDSPYYGSAIFASQTGGTGGFSNNSTGEMGTSPAPEFGLGILALGVESLNAYVQLNMMPGNLSGNNPGNGFGTTTLASVGRRLLNVTRFRIPVLPTAAEDFAVSAIINSDYAANLYGGAQSYAGLVLRPHALDPTFQLQKWNVTTGYSALVNPLTIAADKWYTIGLYVDELGNSSYFYAVDPTAGSGLSQSYLYGGRYTSAGPRGGGFGIGIKKTATTASTSSILGLDYTGTSMDTPAIIR